MQNQTITELYSNDNKSKYSSNPNETPKRQIQKLLLLNFLTKFLTKRKYLMSNYEVKISLYQYINISCRFKYL